MRNTETGLGKAHRCLDVRGRGLILEQTHPPKPTNGSDLKVRFVIRYRCLRSLAYYLEIEVVVVPSIIAAVR
jgi:hypothetical protein